MSTLHRTLSQLSGYQLVRFELADGGRINVDDEEAARRIGHQETKFRALPGNVTGDRLLALLYRVSGLDPHRFVFDLPSSALGTGSTRSGTRGALDVSGFIFARGENGRATGNPVGKVIFARPSEKLRDDDPESRQDFERL